MQSRHGPHRPGDAAASVHSQETELIADGCFFLVTLGLFSHGHVPVNGKKEQTVPQAVWRSWQRAPAGYRAQSM